MPDAEAEKRLRTLRKKLAQIEKLIARGTAFTAEEAEKVASKSQIDAEIARLEAGEPVDDQDAATQELQSSSPAVEPAASTNGSVRASPEPSEDGASLDPQKRAKNIRKKLGQIEKLKEKDASQWSAEEQQKVASEGALVAELKVLEGSAAEGETASSQSARSGVDRCSELLPRLLLEPAAEKRVRQLQKKLREIEKLEEKLSETGKIEKLQEEKMATLPGLMAEVAEVDKKFPPRVSNRERGAAMGVGKAEKSWSKEEGAPKLNKGSASAAASSQKTQPQAPQDNDEDEEEEMDEEEAARRKEERKKSAKESKDLRTKRQQQQQQQQQQQAPSLNKKSDGAVVSAAEATWPEVKDVAASGLGGVDKGRQKTVLLVGQAKAGEPYTSFDRYIFRLSFLTRLELKLPAGVLNDDIFQQGFPGDMLDLVELVLQGNGLTALPPKLGRLGRLRSLDVSHNAISTLPDDGTWEKLSSTLECFDASFNKLTSVAALAPLTKLSTLKLDGNQLTSLAGVSWASLKQLTSITASGNAIEELPEEVAAAGETLEIVDLSENRITSIPVAVCELKKLKELGAAGNPIKDQKVVKYLEKGGKGLKELKVYLPKARTGKKGSD